jgi:hypothetical protein
VCTAAAGGVSGPPPPLVRQFTAYKTRNATGYRLHHFEFDSVEEAKPYYICWQGSLAGG